MTGGPEVFSRQEHNMKDLTRREFLEKSLKTGSVFGNGFSVLAVKGQ
jgi:hypothetical protein